MSRWWNKSARRQPANASRRPRSRGVTLSALPLEDRTVPTVFTNTTPIAIPGTLDAQGNANPFPSNITVSGLTGQVLSGITVTFTNLAHEAPQDIDALLIAPDGTNIFLMSDNGGNTPITATTLTFTATAASQLGPDPIVAGTYLPSNEDLGGADVIPGAPATPPSTSFASFLGIDPNGVWQLRIVDDSVFANGNLAGGWSMDITSRVNTPPVAVDDTYAVVEENTLNATTSVLANDTDAQNDPLTAVLVAGPQNGQLTFNTDGTFTYVPDNNFSGVETFTYRAFDGVAYSNVGTVTINVTNTNDLPVAVDDSYVLQNGGPQTVDAAVGLTANDVDPDGATRQILLSDNFEGLPLVPFLAGVNGGDGTDWLDAPPPGWTRDNLTTPPPANATAPGNTFFGWHVLDVDSWIAQQGGQERDFFTLAGVGMHGSALIADGDAYDDFVQIDDDLGHMLAFTPTINTRGVAANSLRLEFDQSWRPEGNQTAQVDISYDGGATYSSTPVLFYDTNNTPGGANSLELVNNHFVANLNNPVTNSIKLRFTYNSGNNWWWAIDNVKVTGLKTDPSTLTPSIVTPMPAAAGTINLAPSGQFVYTPATGFTGATSFTYRVFDGTVFSNTATVSLQVNANTVAPVANNDSYNTPQGVPITRDYFGGVLANDTDADIAGGNNGLTVTLVNGPAPTAGTLTLNPNGSFTFTPVLTFFGAATFTYRVSDGVNQSNTATATIDVVQTNLAPPVANNDSYNVNNNGVLSVPAAQGVLANDTDPDNNPLTAQLVRGPNFGTLVLNANGSFVYTPRPFYNGPDSFVYRATDGVFQSDVATANITVNNANVAPIGTPDAYATPTGTPLTVTAANGVIRNDRDDGPNIQLFLQDFEGVTLQPFSAGVNGGDGTDWGDNPAGWTLDNTTTPTGGPTEFTGFHPMDIASWIAQQGDQQRAFFTRGNVVGRGTVVVADGDALDDFVEIDPDLYNTLLSTPSISLAGIQPNSLVLDFDSSYRPEDPQKATIEVSYDNGANWINLITLNTPNSGGNSALVRANEHLVLDAFNPAGATTATFRFGYKAGNNWWWAIDNVRASGRTGSPVLTATAVTQPANGSVTVAANGSFTYTPNAGFTGVDTFTYRPSDGTFTGNSTAVSILVGTNAGVVVDNGLPQRSMVRSLTFVTNGPVTFTGDPEAAFTLTNTDTSTPVPFTVQVDNTSAVKRVVITFTDPALIGGSLADGRYRLTALAAQISVNGTPLAADITTDFIRLFGEITGDRTVNAADFGPFRGAFGTTVGNTLYRDFLDFNADGIINAVDFAQFRSRFGSSLP